MPQPLSGRADFRRPRSCLGLQSFHAYPMYMGPGTYDRLARLFIAENTEPEQDL